VTSTVSPTREDGVARAASEVVGGPAGRHLGTGRHGWWTATRVLAVLTVPTMVLAVLARQHCRASGFASPDQFTHACYSDLPALYVSSGLDRGIVPFLQPVDGGYLTQPVGTGGLLGLLAWLAPDGPQAARWVFDLGVVVAALALVATVLAVAALAGRRPWDAALVALSPVVVVAGLVSLDLVAVALAVLGVLAFSRGRPLAAGALIGLAVAVRPMAVLVLVALWVLALRSGRLRTAVRASSAAVLAWAALNLPVLLLNPEGWSAYWASVLRAPVGYGSLWLLPQLGGQAQRTLDPGMRWWLVLLVVFVAAAVVLAGVALDVRPVLVAAVAVPLAVLAVWWAVRPPRALVPAWVRQPVDPDVARWLSAAGVVVVLILVTGFVLGARRRPRLPAVVLLLVVGVLAVSVSVPVQASLWVLPFAALAVPRWRDLLVWASAEVAYATGTWLYLYAQSVPERGMPPWAYGTLLVLRLAAMGWLAWRAVQVSREPALDVVRSPLDAPGLGRDDPAGGELEGTPDALVVRTA
jgi:hypothetical protein